MDYPCDCKDPSQCWEPCGELGNDEEFASVVDYEEVNIINRILKEHRKMTDE